MSRKSLRVPAFAALLLVAGSCALPELTIDPSVDDEDDENGGGTTSGGSGGNGGSGASGGTSGGDQGGKGGTSGGTDGKGGATGGGTGGATGGKGGATGGKGGASGGTAGTGGCNAESDCDAGESCCTGVCMSTDTDPAHCGACNSACMVDQTCENGSCTGPCGTSFEVVSSGWVTAPGANGTCWHGYSYVAVKDSDATKGDLANCETSATGCRLCMSGTVLASEDYSAYAILGVNVAQPSQGMTMATAAPVGNALQVSFTNAGGSQLRVTLSGASGGTDPNDSWCFDIVGSGGTQTIPYTSFRTNCWDTSGTAYNKQPLQSVQLIVPAQATSDVPVDACLLSFADR